MTTDTQDNILKTAELLLRNPAKLIARIRAGGTDLRELPLQLTLIAVCGFASFGFLLGFSNSVLAGALAAPKLVLVGLGSLALCIPALFVYGRLLGNDASPFVVVCEALCALATTGMTLLGLCPVWLGLTHLVSGMHSGYFHVMLGSIAFLGFAGLRGVFVLLGALLNERRPALHLFAWALIYGMVGMQSAWMLRPFVGSPEDTRGHLVVLRPLERSAFDATLTLMRSNANAVFGLELGPYADQTRSEGEGR